MSEHRKFFSDEAIALYDKVHDWFSNYLNGLDYEERKKEIGTINNPEKVHPILTKVHENNFKPTYKAFKELLKIADIGLNPGSEIMYLTFNTLAYHWVIDSKLSGTNFMDYAKNQLEMLDEHYENKRNDLKISAKIIEQKKENMKRQKELLDLEAIPASYHQ